MKLLQIEENKFIEIDMIDRIISHNYKSENWRT